MGRLVDEFVEAISQADIEGATPSYSISIRGAAGGCMMEPDQEKGRFKKVQ